MIRKHRVQTCEFVVLIVFLSRLPFTAQGWEPPIQNAAVVAAQARLRGDPKRGALLFFKSAAACAKCHDGGKDSSPLGPDLTSIAKDAADEYIVESILHPSKAIRKGFETVTVVATDGTVRTGLIAGESEEKLTLRETASLDVEVVIPKNQIDTITFSEKSIMPEGLAETLSADRDLYDLVGYVVEVARGGKSRAEALRPHFDDLVVTDDTLHLDHEGILRSLTGEDLETGKHIYLNQCKACHGADGNTPSLPTARAFGRQSLKYGADPYKMLLTLTRGAGLMTPMQQLSPKERYQVIHFIREVLMKPTNPAYFAVNDEYLSSLPKGTRDGEVEISTEARDFGPALGSQIGHSVNNALTMRLQEDVTVSYDLHRMRLAGVWENGFLDLTGTHHYRQRGEEMPKIDGHIIQGLGEWQWAFNGSFEISDNAKPPRGPVRDDWLGYHGHYLHGKRAILSYAIHSRNVLEYIDAVRGKDELYLHHTLRVDAGKDPLKLSVAQFNGSADSAGLLAKNDKAPAGRRGLASERVVVVSGKAHPAEKGDIAHPSSAASELTKSLTVAAAVVGDTEGMTWEVDSTGRIILTIPSGDKARLIRVTRYSAKDKPVRAAADTLRATAAEALVDPLTMTRGGPQRWPETPSAQGRLGEPINGYALDTIPVPFKNPWNAWLRTSALDFFEDGRAVVTTHGGDVYIVSGIDNLLSKVVWKRFAAGLFEPFGVRVIDGAIYVTCRDGVKLLHDYNGDGEADFIEAFWTDDDVSCSFHAYNFDLQTDSHGNLYLAKAGQYTDHSRPGTILRLPRKGGKAEIVAWGLRTPNGMGKLSDDRFTVSDNQGTWIPAGKISLVKQGRFFGSMPINAEQSEWLKRKHGGELPHAFDEPILWLPQELDNSCGGQVWVNDRRFGPLSGRLLHSSFGKGWLYYLSLQEVNDTVQASIVSLPHQWDAGVMRLRVNPADGQVYGTGLSGWQGPDQGKDGCLQRLRYTGQAIQMIERLHVYRNGIEFKFSFDLDVHSAKDVHSWHGEMWNYLWSENYGSDQFSVRKPDEKGRDALTIANVQMPDSKTVRLEIPDLQVCDQAAIEINVVDSAGRRFLEKVYLTIHEIPEE